jgi:hypothetical protein
LLDNRALAVQKALLESGQIAADRLFVVRPNTVAAANTGQSRVTFGLQ